MLLLVLRHAQGGGRALVSSACICVPGCAGAADFEAADHAKEEAEAELVLSQEEMEK
jgi:hypothetical protein